jgi:hypothetical protein
MSKKPLKFLKIEVIEEVTACRIRQYEAKAGVRVGFPIPIDKIVEQILGLDFDWDEIEERPGEQILGAGDRAHTVKPHRVEIHPTAGISGIGLGEASGEAPRCEGNLMAGAGPLRPARPGWPDIMVRRCQGLEQRRCAGQPSLQARHN